MPKSKWVAFFLCLFFGVLGIHKFYEGRVLLGIVYLLTLGLCGVGVVIDLVILLFKPNPYYP
nr:TM2 domain-containing protein [uncultured Agathobaculum sp.]